MDRRSFLSASGVFAVSTAFGGTFLVGCAPSSGNKTAPGTAGGSLKALTFITPFQHLMSYGDVYVAIKQGFFEAEGLSVTPVGGTGTASSVSQVVAGKGQVGKAAAVVTCPLIADKGADIITIAQGDARSQYSVASDPAKPLTHPEQWQGKTIGVISKGGSTERLLDAMSVAEGLDPTKVKKVVTGADVASLEFLKRGEVDGFITFLGSETALRKMKVDLHYLNTDKFAKMPGDAYFVQKSQLKAHAKDMAGYLRACRKAFQFMADPANTDKVLSAVGAFNPTEVSDKELATLKLQAQVKLCKPASGDFLSIEMDDWESALELMRKSKIVEDTKRPVSDFVTTEIIDAV